MYHKTLLHTLFCFLLVLKILKGLQSILKATTLRKFYLWILAVLLNIPLKT